MTNVVVEQFQVPDTRRCARMLEFARGRAVEQLAGRRTWVIDADPVGSAGPAQACFDVADEALTSEPIPRLTGESLSTLIVLHVRAGDIVVIRDRAAIALSRMARECGAHVIWDRRVSPHPSGFTVEVAPPRRQTRALDAWLMAWTTAGTRAPRHLAAFIDAPGILSAKEMCAGASADSFEQLGWRSLLADIVREDRAERVGGTVAARPSVAPR